MSNPAASPPTEALPLFPLPLVLFPGGRVQLRIFEQRYLDMTRDCSAAGTGFGIVHSRPADDTRPARHAAIGTEAMIEDFATLDDGLLGLTVRGRRRFRIRATRARDNGLIIGEVEWLPDEPSVPVSPEHAVLTGILRELARHEAFAELGQVDCDNAAELGMRLAAVLPLESEHAQELLAVSDPTVRLDALLRLLQTDREDAVGNA
ncbi:MAG: LON peptidase substrate-binding domain-containing protein [Wenzhouxiangellaceae bacterium]|nr:LON peptidase substrate-binding domain-containing protein [Wenzhouxiangellaceae bacterium]